MPKLIIDIGLDGNATVEGKDFVGTECKAISKAVESALGKAVKTQLKPEYRQRETQQGRRVTAGRG